MATTTMKLATLLLVTLLVTLPLACSKEPYPLEGELTGELPDQDLDVEAELADPGGEMQELPHEDLAAGPQPCTPEELEELEEQRKTLANGGRINEEGIVCTRKPPRPLPSEPPTAPR